MMSRFYQCHGRLLLLGVLISQPLLFWAAQSLPQNNDIETWLPRETDVRRTYEGFKAQFGAEEFVLIGLPGRSIDDPLVEALAERIERLAGIRRSWTPARLRAVMREQRLTEAEIEHKLRGLTVSPDGTVVTIIALLSGDGLADRAGTVGEVREQLEYCQIGEDECLLAGVPVVVTELDRFGSQHENQKFFLVTLLICLSLLYVAIGDRRLTFVILAETIWAINLTQAVICWMGGEMNFILSALPAMVMVFTMAIAIHLVHYYRQELGTDDPLGRALRMALRPCCLATLTTVIGLLSLTVSDIAPVRQFGFAAALGSVMALVAGLGITPALFVLWPPSKEPRETPGREWLLRVACGIVRHARLTTALTLAVVLIGSVGLFSIRSHIDPLDFLPSGSRVLSDTLTVEERVTNIESVEAVVDFGTQPLPFVEKMHRVRAIEEQIARHPHVNHTMSVASFFPKVFPDSALESARLLARAESRDDSGEYVSVGHRFWRISARIDALSTVEKQQVFDELKRQLADEPVTFTGITPLLMNAQLDIFRGFWESFATAFAIITGVMIVSLRSMRLALLAMIPNLTPIALVFGALGWMGVPVDIGTMMTASIALGIAVDGTFHFLVHYQRRYRLNRDPVRSSGWALLRTGGPIFSAAAIASVGMLALTLSRFTPTSRFGLLMATLLLAAVVGDLLLLPAMLACPGPVRLRLRRRFAETGSTDADAYRRTA